MKKNCLPGAQAQTKKGKGKGSCPGRGGQTVPLGGCPLLGSLRSSSPGRLRLFPAGGAGRPQEEQEEAGQVLRPQLLPLPPGEERRRRATGLGLQVESAEEQQRRRRPGEASLPFPPFPSQPLLCPTGKPPLRRERGRSPVAGEGGRLGGGRSSTGAGLCCVPPSGGAPDAGFGGWRDALEKSGRRRGPCGARLSRWPGLEGTLGAPWGSGEGEGSGEGQGRRGRKTGFPRGSQAIPAPAGGA